jgi:hypothetical protein
MLKLTPILLSLCMLLGSNAQNHVKKSRLEFMDKKTLADRVKRVSQGLDEIVRSNETSIEKIETPFLRKGAIYRVVHYGKYHPMGFTVGVAEPDFTVMLPLNPAGFMELKDKGQLILSDSPEERLQYVVTFLETTRSFSQHFMVLREFEDIKLIPEPSDREKKEFVALKEKYLKAIKPPSFVDDSKIIVFAVKERNLVKIESTINSRGDITTTEKVLEIELPIPFTD